MMDKDWIEARIPHKGTMCLLDRVEHWTDDDIVCLTDSHRAPDNPLRAADRLGIVTLIEYAAQAMAIHGALLAGGEACAPTAGYLASARDVRWQRARLDDLTAPLRLRASRLSGNGVTVMYRFEAEAGGQLLASGRLSAILDIAALTP
jgi:predicted hotdog family 3-hydroxylacyl-ACP dehydratase